MSYAERRRGRLTGTWVAEVELPPVMGKRSRVRERFATKAEADRWEGFVRLTGRPPDAPSAPNAPTTYGQAMRAAWEAGGPRGKWRHGRNPDVSRLLDVTGTILGQDTPILTVDTAALDRLVDVLLRKRGMGPATVNRHLTVVSAVLRFALSRGMVPRMPDVPWQHEEGRRLLWLTQAEEDAVCSFLRAWGQSYVATSVRVLTATGMRWGEFAGLTPEQVEDAWVRLWKTKSNRPRSIPIAQPLARELRGMLLAGARPRKTAMRNWFKKAVESAGGNPALCVHSLRHTTATRMVQAGVNIAIVQRFLGHSTIQTTLRYAHVSDDLLAEAAQKVSQHAGEIGQTGLRVLEKT